MKPYRYISALTLAVLFFVPAFSQTPTLNLVGLNWLAGCWQLDDPVKKLSITEQWMMPDGGMMLGMGRTVRKGKAVDYEFMRIEERPDGIFFIAQPKANKEETAFKLKSSTASEVTFENPEHDFPQRVMYKLKGADLTGRIEGNNNGKFMGIDFPMKKIKCG